ncbi:MAG: macro domain-containing protein [Spirochaetaceae bacterium]
MKQTIHGVTIELVQGDITKQPDLDAVVNAANGWLTSGGGVAGAIHRAAGPGLAEECAPLAPISPGEAVITSGHNLANPYVIHTLGPVYGKDKPEAEILSRCYRNCLRRGEEKNITSLGFPAISTGVFGYPAEKAAREAIATLLAEAEGLQTITLIRFVLFSDEDLRVHEEALEGELS